METHYKPVITTNHSTLQDIGFRKVQAAELTFKVVQGHRKPDKEHKSSYKHSVETTALSRTTWDISTCLSISSDVNMNWICSVVNEMTPSSGTSNIISHCSNSDLCWYMQYFSILTIERFAIAEISSKVTQGHQWPCNVTDDVHCTSYKFILTFSRDYSTISHCFHDINTSLSTVNYTVSLTMQI